MITTDKYKNSESIKIEIGKVYNNRIILSYKGTANFHRHKFEIKCLTCGKVVIVSLQVIRNCGCVKCVNASHLTLKEAATNRIFSRYRGSAKKRGIEFNLTIDDLKNLIFRNCFYCGYKLSNVENWRLGKVEYNGIDRINNKIGYTKRNSVTCCKYCNRIKSDLTIKELYEWAYRFFNHTIKNGRKLLNNEGEKENG